MGRPSLLHEDSVIVKTPMSLGRFKVKIFSVKKFTKFDLAPKEVLKIAQKLSTNFP